MASPGYTNPLQNTDPKQSVKDQAGQVWNDTKDTARSMLGEQQKAAAGGMSELAGALRKAAREMGGGSGERAPVSGLVESAADGLERFSGALRNQDLDGLVNGLNSFARRQPVAFFGAALTAGFLAVRFLKASGEPRDSDEQNLPY